MTTDATRLARAYAEQRDETDASGDAARVTVRTLMRGDATRDDRAAHVYAALVAAGLVGDVPTTPLPRTLGQDGAYSQRLYDRTFTPQRMAVLQCFAEGQSYTETARSLHLNVATVKGHTGNLYRIFGVASKVECVLAAVRAGVLPAPPAPGGTPAPATPEAPTVAPEASPATPEAPTADDLAGLSRPDLQGLARSLGLPARGTAAAIRERILASQVTT